MGSSAVISGNYERFFGNVQKRRVATADNPFLGLGISPTEIRLDSVGLRDISDSVAAKRTGQANTDHPWLGSYVATPIPNPTVLPISVNMKRSCGSTKVTPVTVPDI